MTRKSVFCATCLLLLITACNNKKPAKDEILSGEYWKTQAMRDIIPAWTRYSQNERSGTFHTNLDSLWKPFGSTDIYPSMISRHLFSYSTAYLLSGREEDLEIAGKTAAWLIEKAWDRELGGWYDALDEEGNPVELTKTTFVQVYVITGLAMYYFVTRDSVILSYIERSNDLLEKRAWDMDGGGGYFNTMNRDWSILDSNKSFSSQVTPVSGYLFYLYLATRDQKYLDQTFKILDVVSRRMIDSESGWVLEDFDKDWEYTGSGNNASEINTGHNIETAWMMLRYYLLTSDDAVRKTGLETARKIIGSGVFNKYNVWTGTAGRKDPSVHGADTYWWIQAYGNMLSLCLYKVTNDEKYLDYFIRGAGLWDSVFVDRKHGDTFFRTDSAGNVLDRTKAGRFKSSYHNLEHCLLNYLYLNLWVNCEPVVLHFRISSPGAGEKLYPVPVEDMGVRIVKVTSPDRGDSSVDFSGQAVFLPADANLRLRVELRGCGK